MAFVNSTISFLKFPKRSYDPTIPLNDPYNWLRNLCNELIFCREFWFSTIPLLTIPRSHDPTFDDPTIQRSQFYENFFKKFKKRDRGIAGSPKVGSWDRGIVKSGIVESWDRGIVGSGSSMLQDPENPIFLQKVYKKFLTKSLYDLKI